MKKIVFLVLLMVALAAAQVQPKVLEELGSKGKVNVIVRLKDNTGMRIADAPAKLKGDIFKVKAASVAVQQSNVLKKVPEFKKKHQFSIINGFSGELDEASLEKLLEDPNVESIEFDEIYNFTLTQSLPLSNTSGAWNQQINNVNLTGAGQTVCVIDTGVDYDHADLGGAFGPGNKVLAGYDYFYDDADPDDDEGHGTHVAGIIAANGVVKGVAPGANIAALKACNPAGCNSAAIISSINWCVTNKATYNISVISISISGGEYESSCDGVAVTAAANNAVDNGLFVSIATGNDAYTAAIGAPSCGSKVTAVGAVYDANVGGIAWESCIDPSSAADQVVCFTNRDTTLDILAPGAMLTATKIGGGTVDKGGTSMACPMVSGAAALLLEDAQKQGYSLTPAQIETAFKNTGKSITTGIYTFPRLDIYAALLSVDSVAPTITINSPGNTTYSDVPVWGNVSLSENTVSCNYSLDGAAGVAMTQGNITFFHSSVSPLAGSHSLNFTCTDIAGNTASEIEYFTLDQSSPSVIFDTGNNSVMQKTTLNFTITDDGTIDTVMYNNGSANYTDFIGSYDIDTTSWNDGVFTVTIYANDTLGNLNESAYRVTIDSTNPLVSAVILNNTQSVAAGEEIEINVTASDSLSGLNNVSLAVGSTNISLQNISGTYRGVYTATSSNGALTVTATAMDNAGNSYTNNSVSITQDNGVPTITLQTSINSVYNTNVSFNYTVTDVNGIDTTFLNASNSSYFGTFASVNNSGTYNATFDITGLSDGSFNLTVYANDTLGNQNTSTFSEVIIDTAVPSLSSISLVENANISGSVSINGTADGTGSSIASVQINNSNYTLNVDPSGTSSGAFSFGNNVAINEGIHSVQFNVTDAAGLTQSYIRSFTVDNTPPAITITSPTNTDYASTSVDLNFSANELTDSSWYNLDTNSNVTSGNTTLAVEWAGNHTIVVYANDTAGNIGSTTVNFQTVILNASKWAERVSSVSSVAVVYNNDTSVGESVNVTEDYTPIVLVIQNNSKEVNISGFNASEANWAKVMEVVETSSDLQEAVENEGTNATAIVWIELNEFLESSDSYNGTVALPETYQKVYYLGGSLTSPTTTLLSECNSTLIDCYNETGGQTLVYLSSFSGVAGSNDTRPPKVTAQTAPSGTVASSSTTLTVTTNEAAVCRMNTTAGTAFASMSSETSSGTTHSWSLTGLSTGTYTYYIRCNDTYGNVNETDFTASVSVSISNNDGGTTNDDSDDEDTGGNPTPSGPPAAPEPRITYTEEESVVEKTEVEELFSFEPEHAEKVVDATNAARKVTSFEREQSYEPDTSLGILRSVISLNVKVNESVSNMSFVETIPKEFAENASLISIVMDKGSYEIIDYDPVFLFKIGDMEKDEEVDIQYIVNRTVPFYDLTNIREGMDKPEVYSLVSYEKPVAEEEKKDELEVTTQDTSGSIADDEQPECFDDGLCTEEEMSLNCTDCQTKRLKAVVSEEGEFPLFIVLGAVFLLVALVLFVFFR